MQKKTVIRVPHTVRRELMRVLNTTYPTVRRALNGDATTDLHRKIRHTALIKGGKEYQQV